MDINNNQNERLVRLETQYTNIASSLTEIKTNMVTKVEFNQVIGSFDRYKNTTKQYYDEIYGMQIRDIKEELKDHEKRISMNQKFIYGGLGAIALFEIIIKFIK